MYILNARLYRHNYTLCTSKIKSSLLIKNLEKNFLNYVKENVNTEYYAVNLASSIAIQKKEINLRETPTRNTRT